jgi:outer membrane assembly lipoprotein YfiO
MQITYNYKCLFYPFIALSLTTLFSACSSSTPTDELKPNEVPTKEVVRVDLPQEQLFSNAKRFYASQLWSVAQESFQALRDGYSPGPYGEFAEIKMADCVFEQAEYASAATLYEEFIKNHPSSPSTPYAILRAGRSHEQINKGTGKDVGALEKARDHYLNLINQYPNSVYTAAAKKYHLRILEKIADYEKFVEEFYVARDKPLAASARLNEFKKNIEPALSNSREDIAKLKQNTPIPVNSSINELTPNVVTARVPALPNKFEKAIDSKTTTVSPSTEYRVLSVQCSKSGIKNILVFLNKELKPEDSNKLNAANKTTNPLSIQIPNASAKESKIDCFGNQDLSVTSNALFSLFGNYQYDLMPLSNPARLMIAVSE